MTKLARYLFGDKEAQTIVTRNLNGEHWYMAADICGLLGISNHSLAVQKYLDEDEHQKITTFIGGYGKKCILVINNSGMLKLVNVAQDAKVASVKQRAQNIPADRLPEDQQHLRLAA